MRVVAVCAALCSVAAGLSPSMGAERVVAPLRAPVAGGGTFVGYLPQDAVPEQPFDRWAGVQVQPLSGDPATGRLAVHARFPSGWRLPRPPAAAQSVEIVLLEGGLEFGEETLGRYDFAFTPPATSPPPLASPRGARALLFFDPPAADSAAVARQRGRGAYVTRYDPSRWQPATLARSAGAGAGLRVMHLKKDVFTTARTWYVSLAGGISMPWEVHSMVEEGYVMEGDYTLAECLPAGTVIGDYGPGAYFWRPGGIAHGGPESGTRAGVIWLQRSPVALDVTFYGSCVDGRASAPVAPTPGRQP